MRTSRFYEKNNNNNKIALNLFQGDINDYNENDDEFGDILTKRGKVKNKAKIEYFKNYINNFKEIKFKTARQIEIFRKKEDKKPKEIKEKKEINEDINVINDNILKKKNNCNNRFNLIKETFQEGRQDDSDKINNNIFNQKNEIENKKPQISKKNKKEINNKKIKNNEELLNIIKKNKNMAKIIEKEKKKMKKKIGKLKEKENVKNLSTGKALELLDKDNEKFLKLIKAKKMRLMIRKQLNKSFNNSYNKDKYFNNENKIESSIVKTFSNENIKRKMRDIQNKFHMKIISPKDIYINNYKEKEIFNRKYKNTIKSSKYLSKSCSNKIDKSKDNDKEKEKIYKNQKKYFKNKIREKIFENEHK